MMAAGLDCHRQVVSSCSSVTIVAGYPNRSRVSVCDVLSAGSPDFVFPPDGERIGECFKRFYGNNIILFAVCSLASRCYWFS